MPGAGPVSVAAGGGWRGCPMRLSCCAGNWIAIRRTLGCMKSWRTVSRTEPLECSSGGGLSAGHRAIPGHELWNRVVCQAGSILSASKRNADYSALSRKVAHGIFSGTELGKYLRQAPAPDTRLALEVDRYAHDRFPHDLTFVAICCARVSFAQAQHGRGGEAFVGALGGVSRSARPACLNC
jgi:hypothetical protein